MEYIKLQELCSIITDGTHQTPQYSDKGYIFLSSKNVTSGRIDWNNVKYISEELHNQLSKRIKPQKNDILLAKNGTTGVAALVETDEVFDIYVSLALLRPNDKVNPSYLLKVINSPYTKYQFNNRLKGVGVKNLHLKEIKEIIVPVPTLDEQEKICKILDKAQELIDKRKEQIEQLDELVKSRFSEMFGDLRDKKHIALNECTNFIDYRGKTPTLSDDGIRMINAKSVGNGVFKFIDEYVSEETYNSWMKRGFPVPGDVLFVTEGHTFGNVCRIPNSLKKFAMGQRVITIQGYKEILNNVFLAQYMQTMDFKMKINKYKTGSSAQGIRSKELQKILIPIPSIKLQNEFADFVNQVDKLKLEMENSLKELEDNFNSLMQKAFKGELF